MVRFILVLLVLLPFGVSSQKVSHVDFDAIKRTLDADTALYGKLLARFINADSTLTPNEVNMVYYGAVFRKGYEPYEPDENEKKFYDLCAARKYEKALAAGEELLKKYPLDIKLLNRLYTCARKTEDPKKYNAFKYRYTALIEAVINSGDGKSDSTAFVVIKISDEYAVLSHLGLGHRKQALKGYCDVFTLSEPGDFGQTHLYFDIRKPFATLMKMFEGQ